MSRSRSYQRSRRDGCERYHNSQLMRRQYADVDHYAAYVASAGPARPAAVEREAADVMLVAQAPGGPRLVAKTSRREWVTEAKYRSWKLLDELWNDEHDPQARRCEGAPFAMPEPVQPLGAVELMDRLEKMGYSHWDAMRLAMKIVTGRAVQGTVAT